MSGRVVIDSGRCDRCGEPGPEGDLGEELWLCEHDVRMCHVCFFFNPCKPCAEPDALGAQERER